MPVAQERDFCRASKATGGWDGFINVHGGGGARERKGPNGERIGHGNKASVTEGKALMGIDWMTAQEMNQAIPPRYTEYLGRRLMIKLERAA